MALTPVHGRWDSQHLGTAIRELEALAALANAECQFLLSQPLHTGMQERLGLLATLQIDRLQHLPLLCKVHLQSNDFNLVRSFMQHPCEIFLRRFAHQQGRSMGMDIKVACVHIKQDLNPY